MNPVAEYDTKHTRLTCVTLAESAALERPISGKRKRDTDIDTEGRRKEESEVGDEGEDDWPSQDEMEEEGEGVGL
jgi:protein MAK11